MASNVDVSDEPDVIDWKDDEFHQLLADIEKGHGKPVVVHTSIALESDETDEIAGSESLIQRDENEAGNVSLPTFPYLLPTLEAKGYYNVVQ